MTRRVLHAARETLACLGCGIWGHLYAIAAFAGMLADHLTPRRRREHKRRLEEFQNRLANQPTTWRRP